MLRESKERCGGGGWGGFCSGKTYRLRISNIGLEHSLNLRIQGHQLTLVEVEGTHTVQTNYNSLDIHLGQSISVLVTADQHTKDYYIAVSTRFTSIVLTSTAVLHYSNSNHLVSGALLSGPITQIDCSAGTVNSKQRYAVNSVSFVPADTENRRLFQHFRCISDRKHCRQPHRAEHVPGHVGSGRRLPRLHRDYLPEQRENCADLAFGWLLFLGRWVFVNQLHPYVVFVCRMDGGQWNPSSRSGYNLRDVVYRCTTPVYPRSWTAIYVVLQDNKGMWNVRTEFWARQYLGQQLYLRVYSPVQSIRDEYPIPKNALLCGRASGRGTALSIARRGFHRLSSILSSIFY
ncbi:hypothetical protein KSP39_PZI001012 [Platanthera zijinensis]|uniref:Plastocyanin-like domain-containing protein n=1 Tax=Platanthera zijinensis TaxID=2320716 RepID=A0AAP0GF66_9ASPA